MSFASVLWALALLAPAPTSDSGAATVERQVDRCRESCATNPSLSDTDRATCRLQCTAPTRGAKVIREATPKRTTVEVHPRHVPQTRAAHEALAQCQTACASKPTPDSQATCKLNCRQTHRLRPAQSQPPAQPRSSAPAPKSVPNRVPSFDVTACYSSCEMMKGSSGVTCRLNCEATAKRVNRSAPLATTPGKPLGESSSRPLLKRRVPAQVQRPAVDSGRVDACRRDCDIKPGLSATDRATCKLGCKPSRVSSERWEVEGSPAQVRCWQHCDCDTGCESEAARCEQSCATAEGTDAATCTLQCRSQAKSCARACPVKADDCTCGATR